MVMNAQNSRGHITKQFDTQQLPNGVYIVRVNVSGKMTHKN
jgi:hypothetical protein